MKDNNRELLKRIQDGLPIEKRPYETIAEDLGLEEEEVIEEIKGMVKAGWIRRIGCIPHHYNLGISSNGMSAWDVPDDIVDQVGKKFGKFDFVSHCYKRPRHKPIWPYNLFAMVHGRTKEEVYGKVNRLKNSLDVSEIDNEVLFSTRLLKKQGTKISK